MTFQPLRAEQSYLPTTIILPDVEKPQEFNQILTDYLKKIVAGLNQKDIAQYGLSEVLNGQQFFTPRNNQELRNIYRKVIDCGPLPNNTKLSVAHQIDVNPQTIFTRIYGCASSPDTRFIPLPFINTTTPGDSVELSVDADSVDITTTSGNYVGFTTTYVVLEYIKG